MEHLNTTSTTAITKEQKQEIALFYQRNSQRATCQKFGLKPKEAKQIVNEVYGKLKSAKDQIEQKHTPREIRAMYAKYLAGKGDKADYEDISIRHKVAAFDESLSLDKIVFELSEVWERFSKCHTMQPYSRLRLAA